MRSPSPIHPDDVDQDVAVDQVEEVVAVEGGVDVAGGQGEAFAAGDGLALRAHEEAVLVAEEAEGAGFELRAVCFSGRIVPAADLGLAVIRNSTQELVGTVGDGGAVVTLSSFSGGIVIGRR